MAVIQRLHLSFILYSNNSCTEKKKILKVFYRILVSILIILVLDFIAGFVIIPESYHSFRTSHYYYHHGLIPNQSALGAWGSLVYPVHTNSLGFMDSTVNKVPLKSANKRLLILGDSHSEGVGVPYLKTFSGRLAKELKDEGVDVLNASCISYSPKIEYLKLKYLIEKEDFIPDYIFQLIDISDIQNELVYENYNPEENFSRLKGLKQQAGIFLNSHSSIYYLVNSIIKARERESFIERAEFFDQTREGSGNNNTLALYSEFFSHFDDNTLLSNPRFHGVGEWYYDDEFRILADKGIESGLNYVEKIKELCDEHGIDLTISVHPWHPQIYLGDPDDYYVRKWRSFAEEKGISFVNLFPLFVNEQNPVLIKDMYYIRGDNHWNEFGHEKVSASLLEFFRKKINEDPEL